MRNSRSGFTLTEVLISICILTLVWVATAGTFLLSRRAASSSKHRMQAIYVAERLLEEQRRLTFASIAARSSAPVIIDTNGTFTNTADDFNGNRVIRIPNLGIYWKRVQIEVNWQESLMGGAVTAREYLTTDITNEPQIN